MIRQKYECYEPVWRHRVIAEMHFGFIKSVGEDFRVTLGVIERKNWAWEIGNEDCVVKKTSGV